MPVTEEDLEELKNIVINFTEDLLDRKDLTGKFVIDTIILYGSTAQNFLGLVDNNNDYDLNVFLRKPNENDADVRALNLQGVPWNAGNYNGKKIDLLFNLLKDKDVDWKAYVARRNSERWNRISNNPILVLHPIRENLDTLSQII